MLGINIGLSHLYSRLLKLFVEPAKLIEREQFWIDWLKPKYNLAPKAGSNLGVKYSDEAKTKMSAWQIGRKMSKEARVKMSISAKANRNALGFKHILKKQEKECHWLELVKSIQKNIKEKLD